MNIQKKINICFMLRILLNNWSALSQYTSTAASHGRCHRTAKQSSSYLTFDWGFDGKEQRNGFEANCCVHLQRTSKGSICHSVLQILLQHLSLERFKWLKGETEKERSFRENFFGEKWLKALAFIWEGRKTCLVLSQGERTSRLRELDFVPYEV